jgi:hypothetical protein
MVCLPKRVRRDASLTAAGKPGWFAYRFAFSMVFMEAKVLADEIPILRNWNSNGKVIVRDGEVVTMDMKPVIETHNRCAFEMANA